MKFTLLVILFQFTVSQLLHGRSIESGDNNIEQIVVRGLTVVYKNPIEWAWQEYRKTTLVLLFFFFLSLSLNIFIYMRYLMNLANIRRSTRQIIRLQPTFQGELWMRVKNRFWNIVYLFILNTIIDCACGPCYIWSSLGH